MSSDEKDEQIEHIVYRRPVKKRKSELVYPSNVHTIQDLIDMAQSGKRFANINNEMLWKISAQLIELNEMIGMKSLKESIFYHVIYYLQNLYVDDERDYLHTVIMGPPGTGKCLGKDTPILMFDGSVQLVQNIQEGDEIMGDDSTPRKILSVCTGRELLYKIQSQQSNDPDDSYVVNKSHILSVYNTQTQQTEDIPLRVYLENPSIYLGYLTSIVYPRRETLSIDPYILGYALMSVMSCSTENEVTVRVRHPIVQSYFECCTDTHKIKSNEYKVTLPNGREMPSVYPYYSTDTLRHLLAGMVDSYGQVDKETNTTVLQFTHANMILYRQIKRICRQLGLSYKCEVKKVEYNIFPTPTNLHPMTQEIYFYYLRLQDYLDMIPSMVYADTYVLPDVSFPLKPTYPISAEVLTEDVYYGFELDGNRRFVLANHVVTHNTTIAKIIGEMYKNMGILSSDGVFKIAKREDFVAEYLGQTAIKTKKLLETCKGGVLFIDEVYALGPGKKDQDSFSKEAIDTINVFLSENSDSFCCIIAGYENDIRSCFFSVNQGLERRFQWVHRIETYTSDELAEMFFKILYDIKWRRDTSVTLSIVTSIIEKNKSMFTSYGGDIENWITKCKMAHAKRIINSPDAAKNVLHIEDLRFALDMMKPHSIQTREKDDTSYMRLYL